MSVNFESQIKGAMKYCQIGPDAAGKLLAAMMATHFLNFRTFSL